MKRMRVALVGCGWVAGLQIENGFAHLPALFEVVACCDLDPKTMNTWADRYNVPLRIARFEDLLQRADIDIVSICTPPSSHHPLVLAAIAAGKNVICEKPFTSSLRKMDEIISAESQSNVHVMPIFQYRFGTGAARVRHVIRSGLAGRPYISSVETAWSRRADYYQVAWRGKFATELGGVLLTQAIHIHDLFMWLKGPVSKAVGFKSTRVNPIEVEDCAAATLVMGDGSLATLTATLGSAQPVTRLRMCFENVTFERLAYDAQAIRPSDEPWRMIARDPALVPDLEAKAAEVADSPFSGFARQFELFHQALLSGGPLPVTVHDARRSLELVTALFHSADSGETVALPIGPSHPKYDGWAPLDA